MKRSDVKVPVLPVVYVTHDEEKYTIEIELAGVEKDKISLEVSERGFCVRAPREDIEYFGCWTLSHDVKPEEAKATFKSGLLTVTIPLAKPMKGREVPIE
ncbi:MAG: Hsp20/alpha crystallin family protein [Candidatus Caldarchaeales archaeon]